MGKSNYLTIPCGSLTFFSNKNKLKINKLDIKSKQCDDILSTTSDNIGINNFIKCVCKYG